MARTRLRWTALAASLAALASCVPEVGAEDDEAATAWPDAGGGPNTPDGCVPNCHWDCFGSAPRCAGGAVVAMRAAPRPCCRPEDFTQANACPDEELLRCREGCSDGDPRYPRLERRSQLYTDPELRQAFCSEGINRRPGDPCSGPFDCRAAAPGVGRLECDEASGTCVEVARPPAPPGLFGPCGLTGDPFAETVKLVSAPDCEVCLVLAPEDRCAAQACTLLCEFDEDCPSGSICSCAGRPPFESSTMPGARHGACYCIPDAGDRFDETPDWLTCPQE